MNVNMLCPTECPDCGEYDRCANNCICPACHVADNEDQNKAMKRWIELSPVMLALTADEIDWNWSRDSHDYSLEIGDELTICMAQGKFLLAQWRETNGYSFDSPAEGDWFDIDHTDDVEGIVSTVRNYL